MKKIMNITTCAEDTGRYTDRSELRSFCLPPYLWETARPWSFPGPW